MDAAIVTGADTPLGLEITKHLILQGYHVHGIGNNFSNLDWGDDAFTAHAIDLTDINIVCKTAKTILETQNRADLLVHTLDVTPGAAFEKLPIGNLEAILKVGLLGPVLLTRIFLPNLLRYRGQLIHIIPTNKSGHTQSAINALILGGLREMNLTLFNPCRDQGMRITNLIIHTNESAPKSAKVSARQLHQSQINYTCVLRSIKDLLKPHATNIPAEITIYPQLSPQATKELADAPLPIDPYKRITLPPKKYCPPEPTPIPTEPIQKIVRTIPYSDEEIEELITATIEDFDVHTEQHKAKNKSTHGTKKKNSQRINRHQKKHKVEKKAEQNQDLCSNHNRKNKKSTQSALKEDNKKDVMNKNMPKKLPLAVPKDIPIKLVKEGSRKNGSNSRKRSSSRKLVQKKATKRA